MFWCPQNRTMYNLGGRSTCFNIFMCAIRRRARSVVGMHAIFVINPKSCGWSPGVVYSQMLCQSWTGIRSFAICATHSEHCSFYNLVGPQFYFHRNSIYPRVPEDPTNDVCLKQVHRCPRGLSRQLHSPSTSYHQQPLTESGGNRFYKRPSQAATAPPRLETDRCSIREDR